MKPVLLATDGSPTAEKATGSAIDLARLLGTELVIASVWDVAFAGYSAMGLAPMPMSGELARLGEEQATKAVAEAAARAEEAGVETRSVVLPVSPSRPSARRPRVRSSVPRHRLARLGSGEACALWQRVHRRSPSRDLPGARCPCGEGRERDGGKQFTRNDQGVN